MAIKSLRPHQTKALSELKNGSILCGDVGSGKTITALFYYYTKVCKGMPKMPGVEYRPMETPRDLVVITTARKRDDLDWQDEASFFGLGRESNEHGVQMHVDSWNNISQYEDWEDAFFIFDEQRLVGSGAWVKTFLKLAAKNQWIMLSATPGDNWMEFIPVFIANGFYRNRTAFCDEHVVWDRFARFPKPKDFRGTAKLNRLRNSILVDMPFVRHTTRHVAITPVDFDSEQYELVVKKRWNPYEDRPIKDVAELHGLMRRVVGTDPSRLGAVLEVLEKHDKLIIFYNFNYELEMLRTLGNIFPFPVAEWNGHKHEPVPETDRWVYLVQYTSGAEGWNCIETNAILFWTLNYSWKIFEQAKGRIDRMNTPFFDLYYYVLRSTASIDQSIWKALVKKEKFNERKYVQAIWDAQQEEFDLAA